MAERQAAININVRSAEEEGGKSNEQRGRKLRVLIVISFLLNSSNFF